MSQLSALTKQIEAYRGSWLHLQARDDVVSDEVRAVEAESDCQLVKKRSSWLMDVRSLMADLASKGQDSVDKMSAKMNQIDPVSGEKRFGSHSQEKFLQAQALFQQLIGEIQVAIASAADIVTREEALVSEYEAKLQHQRDHDAQRQKQLEIQQQEEEEKQRIRRLADEEAASQLALENAKLMHERAEAIRHKKLDEGAEANRFHQEFKLWMLSATKSLTARFGVLDQGSKLMILQAIKTHVVANSGRGPTLRDVIGLLMTILDRIISNPDDGNARKLRVTHPALQAKLMTIPCTLQLVISFGFQAILRDAHSSDVIQESDEQESSVDNANGHSLWCREVATREKLDTQRWKWAQLMDSEERSLSDFTILHMLLNPHSPYDVILEMQEPVVDEVELLASAQSGDLRDPWSTWYDSLKDNRALLEKFLMDSR